MDGPLELEQDIECQSAAVQGSSFTGPAYQEPRAAGPGGKHLGLQLGKVLCHRHRSQWQPIRGYKYGVKWKFVTP